MTINTYVFKDGNVWHKLSSSMLEGCRIDGNDLLVMFAQGKCYRVARAADKLDALREADSAGQFYNRELKNKFEIARAVEYE
jgi:hypothetical protein